ncbi:hypothetical protein [Photobacterium damselae]|uniref:hypothetical protein n=1 Tax=Photobacterium damselae TaxID=38293 RepID=UPI0025428B48
MKYFLLIIATLCFSSSVLATNVKYSFEFITLKTLCFAQVNGVNIANSRVKLGTVSSGYDLSNIIKNGKNIMTIYFAGIDVNNSKKIEQDAHCTLLIKEQVKDDMINYVSLVGNSLNGLASGKKSPHYDGLGQAGKVTEGYWDKIEQLYKVERKFTVSGVQEWTWTKGGKITDSERNRNLLYKKYISLYKKLKNNDEHSLMDFYHVALSESASNDNDTIEAEWKSLGISKMLDDGYKPRLDYIDNYKIVTYADGQLFRLENDYKKSPIKMDKEGEKTIALNPYFAYVDGEIIVAL